MFKRARMIFAAALASALAFGSSVRSSIVDTAQNVATRSIAPYSPSFGFRMSSAGGYYGRRSSNGSVARDKRAAQKRRNRARYKASLKG